MTPDATGKFKGISVPGLPYEPEVRKWYARMAGERHTIEALNKREARIIAERIAQHLSSKVYSLDPA